MSAAVDTGKRAKTPAQDATRDKILRLKVQLENAYHMKSRGLDGPELRQSITKLKDEITKEEKHLKVLQQSVGRSKNFRDDRTKSLKRDCEDNPEMAKNARFRGVVGRPSVQKDQPHIIQTMIELATFGASAEEKRRSEVLRSCMTLDDLHQELLKRGFPVSRTTTYRLCLPRRYDTNEGRRHKGNIPVRLAKPGTSLHKHHVDQYFCVATIRGIEAVASTLGPEQVLFLSQDDKSRVPLGITAVNKQAPMLMNMEYQVSTI